MLRYYARAREVLRPEGIELVLSCAGSEGAISRSMAQSHGWRYIERPNLPLSDKWNATLHGLRDCDAVIIVGSDDWLSHALLRSHAHLVRRGADYIGLVDQFFVCARTRRLMRFRGYENERRGEPVGIGRCLSKRVVDGLGSRLWGANISKGLDGSMTHRLGFLSFRMRVDIKRMRDFGSGCVAIDVKSATNIWGFDHFLKSSNMCTDLSVATRHLGKIDVQRMESAMQKERKAPLSLSTAKSRRERKPDRRKMETMDPLCSTYIRSK